MKAIKIGLVLLGVLCLVVCFWYRSGQNEVEEGTRQWRTVGLSISPWYDYEKVTRPDGSMASSETSLTFWNLTTLVGIAALGCFKLATSLRVGRSQDEKVSEHF